jgi:predicted nucleotide-binding protein
MERLIVRADEELFACCERLKKAAEIDPRVDEPLDALEGAAKRVKRSFSGSWLGYHSRVYYAGLQPPPPGAHFSQEWGLKDRGISSLGSRGDWREFEPEEVKSAISHVANNPDLEPAELAAKHAVAAFSESKSAMISILEIEIAAAPDAFLSKLKGELEELDPMSPFAIAQVWSPKGQMVIRDMIALNQKNQIPPHIEVLAQVASIRHAFTICKHAAEIAMKAGSHLERRTRRGRAAERIGTNVFIGHGRSGMWRELKDFVQDRLGLPWDEFNRVPVAGVTNIARLSEMLDAAAIAFLVMTAEDEVADGEVQARMNVVHEAGLFQGRLGFTRAIVLLEEGCKEFSNIQGLGQIRFPKGQISASFEEIRRVVDREGLIDS